MITVHFSNKMLTCILPKHELSKPLSQETARTCPLYHLNTIQILSAVCLQDFDYELNITSSEVKVKLSGKTPTRISISLKHPCAFVCVSSTCAI